MRRANVMLWPETDRSLNRLELRVPDTPTDSINRAVILYDLLTMMAKSEREIYVEVDDFVEFGDTYQIRVRRCGRWHRLKRRLGLTKKPFMTQEDW